MKEDSVYFTKRKRFWKNLVEARIYLPQSFSKLYRAIRKAGYPTVSRTTVQRHLNRLLKEHVLVKYPKISRRYNETLYGLDTQMLEVYRWKRVALQLQVVAKRLDRWRKSLEREYRLEEEWEQEQL
ncbi:MAG: hypothetical protein WBV72_08650, partial [Nitrososphaeraceae archaeon]